jgi:uncharacterized membrane protein YgcG
MMPAMIERIVLLAALLRATLRAQTDLVVENLLLRQQLAVLTRPTRRRPRLRTRDRLFWLLARLARPDWRQRIAWSGRRQSLGGIVEAGGCSGAGGRADRWAALASAPRSGI